MNCDDFRAAFLAGHLDDGHFAHLSGCKSCRAEQSAFVATAEVLRDGDVWQDPRDDLRERVVESVRLAAEGPPPRRRALAWLAAAAAAAVLVAGAALVVTRLADRADWEVALRPTDLAPAAAASVSGWNTGSGTRLAIEASGLDPAPAGFVYELWFSAEDQHVSAGTFAAVDDVTAWVGVRRGDFPRVWITLEALDGDPGPSRSTVLDTGG